MQYLLLNGKTAVRSLQRNVLRATLTTLGIVIGIAAVIAMMEIGAGSSAAIQSTIANMGSNVLMIMPGTVTLGGVSMGSGSGLNLTTDDATAISRDSASVRYVAPFVRARVQVLYNGNNYVPNQIYGTTPAYLQVEDWDMASGRCFTSAEVRSAAKVCVLGQTTVNQLFGTDSPIGKEVYMRSVPLEVIGVLKVKGANMLGMDQDDILLLPWTTLKYRVIGSTFSENNQSAADEQSTITTDQLYPEAAETDDLYPADSETAAETADFPVITRFDNVNGIMVSAWSASDIDPAIDQITQLLRSRHQLTANDENDFTIRNMTEITDTLAATTNTMTNLLLGVALISLIVGGVGIMNIMLVSVTERTKEIGLRMAVGAAGRDVLLQFLFEAVLLCMLGGALGIGLGMGGSWLISALLHWPTQVSVPAIIAAVVVAVSVGLVFGYYPAWKASKLDPIQALRYE
ncbi:MAG TPA: ABC transporter permease [Phycisphaerae bacterium]|nr:ABC transporter permease [Phycisphaerae bacterium]